ncbi:HAMP domain-containing histidine kinase [Phenylobacterium sp. LH3H17]|uniref:sensor histidine kinase n=1 Tax=Phenylobacterium sp. LH3H17 TaxID=2903901 RepID=UPI0020C96852|nr:HAMP domain-containing sensor histidine kinase [Phenylobacterium sp. LH3H17]UTP40883.1 HAMP domain-containing histidine kinase [Phenylobacterium sp. LH3H17]
MIGALKDFAKRHWPALRLRTILLSVLLFAAALPGLGAIGLRVYENALVRQTEAELVAQGAALAAVAGAGWPGARPPTANALPGDHHRPEPTSIDLYASPILAERPAPAPGAAPDLRAVAIAARLAPVIAETTRTTLASVILLDGRGAIADARPGGGSLAALPEVQAALAGAARTVIRRNGDYHPVYSFEWLSRASAVRLHHARPVVANGQVVGVMLLSRSPRALFRGLYEDRGKIAVGVAGIFGMLIVLSGLVSRGVTRPIEALSAASREVAAGRGGMPATPTTAAIEIRALYEDFRAMSEAIDRRSGYLRDFAAAVSHEFKTPLAGIGGAVELLQDHAETMSPEERRGFLDNIAADNARLSRLVTRLLDLARADMAQPPADAALDLAAPVRRVADGFANEAFAVRIDLPPALPRVAVPEATLETVLAALLQNSRQAGARQATLAATVTEHFVTVTLADDGPGVPAADRERLFEPFFTSRRAEGGTGLGLPIARSLLAASHGRLELVPSPAGARFEIVLPRVQA